MILTTAAMVQVGIAAAGAVSNRRQTKQAVSLEQDMTREQLRVMDEKYTRFKGEALAQIGGAGVTMEGTPQNTMDMAEKEYQSQRAHVEKMGAASVDTRQAEGVSAQIGTMAKGIAGVGQAEGWWNPAKVGDGTERGAGTGISFSWRDPRK